MPIHKLTDSLYIAPQLTEADVQEAVRLGIQTVICNRPDGEEEGQPSFETVKEWLHQYGIEHVVYMPMVMEHINDADLQHFQETVAKSPAPILAYCRTGTRSAMMWALNQAKRGVEVNSLIRAADLAGINLEPHRERLNAVYQKCG